MGIGFGGLGEWAIATQLQQQLQQRLQRHSGHSASGSNPGDAVSDPLQRPSESQPSAQFIDLKDLRSPDLRLTAHQREVLQCLWLMAAIAPTVESLHAAREPDSVHDFGLSWTQLLQRLAGSEAVLNEWCDVLCDMGFSKGAILNAWAVVVEAQTHAPQLSQNSPT